MKKETTLNINGEIHEASIEYKNIRSIRWVVKDGKYTIRCPYLVTNSYLENVLSKHKSRPTKVIEKPFSDTYCWIYGEKQEVKDGFISIDGHFVLFSSKTFYKDINKYFLTYIETRIKYYENLMNVDKPYNVSTKYVSTRYGSNSKRTHHITINTYLIHFSKDIIDAIIVHELAHCFYYDHSKNFYNFVYKYCSDYDSLHKALRSGNYKGVNK